MDLLGDPLRGGLSTVDEDAEKKADDDELLRQKIELQQQAMVGVGSEGNVGVFEPQVRC